MKASKNIRFSVVIPCYNEESYIANTLRSLQKQITDVTYEVIVVDNNCTDATSSIAKKLGARVVRERMPGVCAARQKGATVAKGEIIVSTDADTVFSTHWLQNIQKAFLSDPSVVAVSGPCRYYDGPWWGKIYTHFLFGWSCIYAQLTGHPFYITATNTAFKKSAWTGYDLSLTQGGDELGLLHQLKSVGAVSFMNDNPTYTSGRRLERGMFYSIFVSFLFYYFAGYHINSLFKRTIIGSAPAFRNSKRVNTASVIGWVSTFLLIISLSFYTADHKVISIITDNFNDFTSAIYRLF